MSTLFAAQGDDGKCAGGPSREHVQARNKFHDERRQKERVKSNGERLQRHDHDIDGFIDAGPAEGPEQKLNGIRHHSHGAGDPNTAAREHGW